MLLCASLWAQGTAQIGGTAKDQSGAVLPGVEITVTQTETGIARSAVTNETGSYVLPNLAIGPYRLEAALPGFRTFVQTGIVLQVNSSPSINVVLDVGQVAETIEVQANAALVETRSSTVGAVIENERILELPLNGRNVTDLITLTGAAVVQRDSGAKTGGGSPEIAFAGGAGWGVDYTLDGANSASFKTGSTLVMPFPDAMQEFKVETSGVSAQSRNTTAVAAVTKSGTNEVHGNLFEFVRNDLFNARNYFATTGSTLKRNQFGGTIGGPIVKNKLFYFGGYQGTTLRVDSGDNRAFVPTPAMLAGDWTAFASPVCNAGRQLTLRAPFVNNRIDPALFSKAAVRLVTQTKPLPFPTSNDPCGEITYRGSLNAPNEAIYVGKVDFQQTDKHSMFGRVLVFTHDEPNPEKFNTNGLQETGWKPVKQGTFTFGSTYLLGSNTVQAFRLSANRSAVYYYNVPAGVFPTWCDLGVNVYCAPEVHRITHLTVSGGFPMPGGYNTGFRYVVNTFSLNNDVSIVRGAHQMSFGVNAMYGQDRQFSIWATQHQFRFTGGATGSGLSDFMTGRAASFFTGRSNPHNVNGKMVGLYATDTWKTTPNLTLSYGVRWEPYLPQDAEAIYNFDVERFRQGIRSSVFPNAPAGMYYRGDPGFPENGVHAQWMHFSPRAGLAWDVSGNGRTSVRASYAYTYVFVPSSFREGYSGGPPWGGRVTISNPVGGLDDPWKDVPGGNIFPYELDRNAKFPPSGLFYTQRYDLKTPFSNSWSLSVQRQIDDSFLLSASYLGSNTIHVWGNNALNPAIYFAGGPCTLNGVTYNPCSSLTNTEARRRFTLIRPEDGIKMGYVAEADDGGTQVYHGMLLSLERRAARGVTLSGNYTWSHCLGSMVNLYNAMNGHPDDTYTDPTNRRLDDGNCESDRRHVFNLTAVAETPQFSNPTLRLMGTGWRLSGIYRKSAGNPLEIINGSDRALNGLEGSGQHQRPNQILENPYSDRSAGPLSRFLNPSAFAVPDTGTLGLHGRNSIQGPGTWSFDLSLARVFRFRESQRLEFRAEAYNVTNSFRPGNPITAVNNANFGVIRTSLDPRILQFALKYVF
jgi:hypothetical protein